MSLDISYPQLRRNIGRFLGIGRNPQGWTQNNTEDVEDILQAGLRQFYWPSIPGREGSPAKSHSWSFLRRDVVLKFRAGQVTASLESGFSKLTNVVVSGKKISVVSEDDIRVLQATKPKSAAPHYFAVQSVGMDLADGGRTRYEAIVYPTPIVDVELSIRYESEPPVISEINPNPLGGARFAEVILECCLAASERVLDPEAGEGLHSRKAAELLASAVELDLQAGDTDRAGSGWTVDDDTQGDSLAVTRGSLKRLVGKSMGFGANSGTWSQEQSSEVLEVLRSGLRRFYQPMVLPGEKFPHNWSFLTPLYTLALVSGQSDYDLPPDFNFLKGGLSYEPGNSVLYTDIKLVSESRVRSSQQLSTSAARPSLAAVRVKPHDAATGTRYELLLWPVPSQPYNVQMRYAVNPDAMGDDDALPMGGQPHSQTLIEACLASSEVHQGNSGEHMRQFQICLQASIGHDRQSGSPEYLIGNRSSNPDGGMSSYFFRDNEQPVSYNGKFY